MCSLWEIVFNCNFSSSEKLCLNACSPFHSLFFSHLLRGKKEFYVSRSCLLPLCTRCSSLVLTGAFLFGFSSFRPFEVLQVKVYSGLGGHFLSSFNCQVQQFPHVLLLCYKKKNTNKPKTKQMRNHIYKNNTFSKDNITKNIIPTSDP